MKTKKKHYLLLLVFVFTLLLCAVPTQAASAKWKKACKAYKSYLAKNVSYYEVDWGDFTTRNYESKKKIYAFVIADLDKNGVPELITTYLQGYKQEIVYVYTYKNGKVTKVKNTKGKPVEIWASSTAQGYYTFRVCGKKHLHLKWNGGWMGYHETVYKISGGKLKVYMEANVDDFLNKKSYKINGKKVSAKKFSKTIKKCKETSKGQFRRNNSYNRSKYVK